MGADPRQQWQAFASLFAPGGAAAQFRPAAFAGDALAPFAAAAERFSAAASAYLHGAKDAASAVEAARVFGEFLREQLADVPLPWTVGPGMGAETASLTDAPALGPMREHQRRWQRSVDAARRIERAQRRLQRLWSDALREAAGAFTTRLQAMRVNALEADKLTSLYGAWIDCAEEAYARVAHGEEFCAALGDYVNAGSAWRTEAQAALEVWAKQWDLPTRSELNSLAERLRAAELRLETAESQLRAAESRPTRKAPRPARKARS